MKAIIHLAMASHYQGEADVSGDILHKIQYTPLIRNLRGITFSFFIC
jgi:hypothetical protein